MQKEEIADLQIRFGVHLRKIREDKGLSLREVADRCDLDNSNISKIENGQFNIQLSKIFELAKGLGVSAKDLLDF
ncbi:helix-turn-helix domain-containing protein [Hufsiella ginkgonis]|uniref:Helix-turn-helix domain-containing protein n=1 Tax=Hufsiella ginkgonis TaxID=2695274 RepID=A0A7K1XTL1_9SPHI|nr:helix-turn-helix transcriptional regulator [Hufsiella ginkgonis]MXV14304.1 helix-turn-helix domain-containing protein [Hufsiella ginkgonis]